MFVIQAALKAIGPLLNEALAAVRAIELALENNWPWVALDMVLSLRIVFSEHLEWSMVWVPRRSNFLAHLLAKLAARFKIRGWVSISCIPGGIVSCDDSLLLYCFSSFMI